MFSNPMGKIHGGAMATWVDVLTSLAIFAFDEKERIMSVSINITQDFINAGNIGEDIYFKAVVKKLGRNIAFTECVIYNQDMKILSTASHKKAFVYLN